MKILKLVFLALVMASATGCNTQRHINMASADEMLKNAPSEIWAVENLNDDGQYHRGY